MSVGLSMRSPDDLLRDLEADRLQREAELRLVENIAAKSAGDAERNMLLRSLTLLTYAHFEGFCKFALLAYASAVNAISLPCREASHPIAAASLGKVFAALRDPNSKSPEFNTKLGGDQELHMLWRERTFVASSEVILGRVVDIPDRIIDTKSNLNTLILKRNLYQLGLPFALVEAHRSTIDKLLGIRNAIAHGDSLKIPTTKDASDALTATFDVMRFVQDVIVTALRDGAFRRPIDPPQEQVLNEALR